MCNCTDCQEDRREAYKLSMMRDEADDADLLCTYCKGTYAQSPEGYCNECADYFDGRLLGYQVPHDEERDA